MTEASDSVRVDVWLWRARFFKPRARACRMVEEGRVRLTRASCERSRLVKGSCCVRPGDELVFAIGGRVHAVRPLALGDRRGPAEEARALYAALDAPIDSDGAARQGDGPERPPAQ